MKYVFLPKLNEHDVIIHCVIGVLLMDYEHLHVDCSGWRWRLAEVMQADYHDVATAVCKPNRHERVWLHDWHHHIYRHIDAGDNRNAGDCRNCHELQCCQQSNLSVCCLRWFTMSSGQDPSLVDDAAATHVLLWCLKAHLKPAITRNCLRYLSLFPADFQWLHACA